MGTTSDEDENRGGKGIADEGSIQKEASNCLNPEEKDITDNVQAVGKLVRIAGNDIDNHTTNLQVDTNVMNAPRDSTSTNDEDEESLDRCDAVGTLEGDENHVKVTNTCQGGSMEGVIDYANEESDAVQDVTKSSIKSVDDHDNEGPDNVDKNNDSIGKHQEEETLGWEMIKVFSISEMTGRGRKRKCSTNFCNLHPAVIYQRKDDPDLIFYCCLDCQEKDFGGWPTISNFPFDSITEEHKEVLKLKCSNAKNGFIQKFSEAYSTDNAELTKNRTDCDDICHDGIDNNMKSVESVEDEKHAEEVTRYEIDPTKAEKKDELDCEQNDIVAETSTPSCNDIDQKESLQQWEISKVIAISDMSGRGRRKKCSSCDLLAAVVYVNSEDSKLFRNACLDCLETVFGGWPEIDKIPIDFISKEHKEMLILKCSTSKNAFVPDFDSPNNKSKKQTSQTETVEHHAEDYNEIKKSDRLILEDNSTVADTKDSELEGAWKLIDIMSLEALSHEAPMKCSMNKCSLSAAVVWGSCQVPTEKWFGCVDCQRREFGGWPDNEYLPLQSMTREHIDIIVSKCSKYKRVKMPSFSYDYDNNSPPKEAVTQDMTTIATVTPLPICGKRELDCTVTTDRTALVTPSEENKEIQGLSKKEAANLGTKPREEIQGDKIEGSVFVMLSDGKKEIDSKSNRKTASSGPKPSKEMLEIHRKWQETAEAMGGTEARIVVSKPEAKKLIYDALYDSFRPINITDIFKLLKAVVPNVVLKTCLDDMALDNYEVTNQFAESDDERDVPQKKKKSTSKVEPYPLCFKAGRNPSTSLYYVDYNAAKQGEAFDSEARNELFSNVSNSEAEIDRIRATINSFEVKAAQLLSEPKNDEATSRLEIEESSLEAVKKLHEELMKFKVNEKHRKQLKRRIDHMVAEWRKRRRMCMDFLISMEESTEGTISLKKCLSGDGQIDIDSDEAVIKQAVSYGKQKRSKSLLSTNRKRSNNNINISNESTTIFANESFVGVRLDSQGCVTRVHIDDP